MMNKSVDISLRSSHYFIKADIIQVKIIFLLFLFNSYFLSIARLQRIKCGLFNASIVLQHNSYSTSYYYHQLNKITPHFLSFGLIVSVAENQMLRQ